MTKMTAPTSALASALARSTQTQGTIKTGAPATPAAAPVALDNAWWQRAASDDSNSYLKEMARLQYTLENGDQFFSQYGKANGDQWSWNSPQAMPTVKTAGIKAVGLKPTEGYSSEGTYTGAATAALKSAKEGTFGYGFGIDTKAVPGLDEFVKKQGKDFAARYNQTFKDEKLAAAAQSDLLARFYSYGGGKGGDAAKYSQATNLVGQLSSQASQLGYSWENATTGNHAYELAAELADRGVTDISKLQYKDGKLVNTATGKQIDLTKGNVLSSNAGGRGDGFTYYRVGEGANGQAILYPQWEESSDKGKIITALAIAAALTGVGAAAGAALGASGTAATALGNGLVTAGLTKAGGASWSDSLKAGVIGGAGTYGGTMLGEAIGGVAGQVADGVAGRVTSEAASAAAGSTGSAAGSGVGAGTGAAAGGAVGSTAGSTAGTVGATILPTVSVTATRTLGDILAGQVSAGVGAAAGAGASGAAANAGTGKKPMTQEEFRQSEREQYSSDPNATTRPAVPTTGGGSGTNGVSSAIKQAYQAYQNSQGNGGKATAGGGGLVGSLIGAGTGAYNYGQTKEDKDRAYADYLAAAKYQKEMLDRMGGLSTSLQGQVDKILGASDPYKNIGKFTPGTYTPASAGDLTNNAYVKGAQSDADNKLGAAWQQQSAAAAEQLKATQGATKQVQDALTGLGDRKVYGEGDVNALAGELYGKRTGALDRALALASSQGFAGALTSGLADSTQAGDTRDDVVRRFSAEYANLDAQSRLDAMGQVKGFSDLQETQRAGTLEEVMKAANPELQAQILATLQGSADGMAGQWASADAAERNRVLEAIQLADKNSQTQYQYGYDAQLKNFEAAIRQAETQTTSNNSRLGALLAALGSNNGQLLGAAGNLADTAGKNYQGALLGQGQALQQLIAAGTPIAGAVGGAAADWGGKLVDAGIDWAGDAASDWWSSTGSDWWSSLWA